MPEAWCSRGIKNQRKGKDEKFVFLAWILFLARGSESFWGASEWMIWNIPRAILCNHLILNYTKIEGMNYRSLIIRLCQFNVLRSIDIYFFFIELQIVWNRDFFSYTGFYSQSKPDITKVDL